MSSAADPVSMMLSVTTDPRSGHTCWFADELFRAVRLEGWEISNYLRYAWIERFHDKSHTCGPLRSGPCTYGLPGTVSFFFMSSPWPHQPRLNGGARFDPPSG